MTIDHAFNTFTNAAKDCEFHQVIFPWARLPNKNSVYASLVCGLVHLLIKYAIFFLYAVAAICETSRY